MPSFQRLLVLAILGVSFANAAVVPSAESTDVGAANENGITPDYVTEAFAKVQATPKKTTHKKTTVKAMPTHKKTTVKSTPTHKKTTVKSTPTHKKTTVKSTPTHKKTTVKATPTSKKTATPKPTKAKPTLKPTSVKKTSTKSRSTKAKPTMKPTGTKVSSVKPSSTSGASCAFKPKGGKRTREELHSYQARGNSVELGGKEGVKGEEPIGHSFEAVVYELTKWDGKLVTDLVIKFTDDAPSAQEVSNLKACQRYTFGPNMDCSGDWALVMVKGQGAVLVKDAGWIANKQALIPRIAQQVAAMCVDWMHKYGRMHTDLHPGNIMVSGTGTDLTVVDLIDLGSMLQADGTGRPGDGAFASWNTDVSALAQTLEADYLLR